MLLSKQKIQTLNESELRQKILIPLFSVMGFKHVDENHGPWELGKDLLMWREGPLDERSNLAVVVKAVAIKSGNVAEVISQARQAFNSSFKDSVTGIVQQVDEVYIVTSHQIPSPTREKILADLGPDLSRRVRLIDGEKLVQLVYRYGSPQLVWEPLREAQRTLLESFPSLDFDFVATRDKLSVKAFSSGPKDSAELEVKFRVDGSSPGMEKFLKEGEEVEIRGDELMDVVLPEALEALMGGGGIEELKLGPGKLPEPIFACFRIEGREGFSHELRCIEFTHVQAGTEGVTIRNDEQSIPIRVALRLDRSDSRKGNLTIGWKFGDRVNALQFYEYTAVAKLLSGGADVVVQDLRTGLVLDKFTVDRHDGVEFEVPPGALEFAQDLLVVQGFLNSLLEFGVDGMSSDERQELRLASQAISQGYVFLNAGESLTLKLTGLPESVRGGKSLNFGGLLAQDRIVTVCGKAVHLGRVVYGYEGFASTIEDSKDGQSTVVIEASESQPIVLIFADLVKDDVLASLVGERAYLAGLFDVG